MRFPNTTLPKRKATPPLAAPPAELETASAGAQSSEEAALAPPPAELETASAGAQSIEEAALAAPPADPKTASAKEGRDLVNIKR